MVQSYDDLSKKLWQLKDLPLSITSVQGAHQALRYTQVSHLCYIQLCDIFMYVLIFLICPPQVFPPVPVMLDYSFFDKRKNHLGLLPKEDKPCPCYIAPIKGNVFQTFLNISTHQNGVVSHNSMI